MGYKRDFSRIFGAWVSTSLALGVLSSCANITSNCMVSPSGLVSWWDGGNVSGTQALDILGLNPGSLLNVNLQNGPYGTAFAFFPTKSSVQIPASSSLNMGSQFSILGTFNTSSSVLSSVTQTLANQGERLSTINSSQFNFFDTSTLSGSPAGFSGGIYDGRYIYMAPTGSNFLVRYDTTQSFTSTSAWTDYNLANVNPSVNGFAGIAFDGRYFYLAPAFSTISLKYDTQKPFNSSSSWQSFDIAALGLNTSPYIVFYGPIFDGSYMYFVPRLKSGVAVGLTLRYNITSNFSSTSSWQSLDLTTINPSAKGFIAGNFDGRYIYFSPYQGFSSLVTRFDSTQSFTSPSSWTFYDVSQVNPSLGGFLGTWFDGKYLYFIPGSGAGLAYVAQLDATQNFSSSAAWSYFDINSVFPSITPLFAGGAYDGRYFYFDPYYLGAPNGNLMRYDSAQALTSMPAWTLFNQATVNGGAIGPMSATFDGRYIYQVPGTYPSGRSLVTQIDTMGNQTSFDLKISNVISDGYGTSVLGPSFSVNTSIGYFKTISAQPLSSGWHTIAGIYDGTQIQMYVDGNLQGSTPASGVLDIHSNPLTLGNTGHGSSSWNGKIQGIQIYNRALTASEVQNLNSISLCK